MAQKISLTVAKKEQLTNDIYVVTFRLVEPKTITFFPGQNMMLMIAPGVNRTMSIASPPSSNTELLMLHDVSPMGPGSKWTVGLHVGDTATIVAPTGGALAFLPTQRRKVLVATGTGIAPFRAMMMDALEHKSSIPMTLYWGMRHESDVYWQNDFDIIAANHSPFMWHLILSQPETDWQGKRGHVTEHVLEDEKNLSESEFYLCGNKAMIEELRAKLIERNVPKEQIKTELFF
jgi:NAD(P)H-flavin reductase